MRFVGKHKCFLALIANRAAPTASRRYFGKENRSSYEVRDSFKESGNGVGGAAGLQCVGSDKSQFDLAESDDDQRGEAQTRRLQTPVGWQRSCRRSQHSARQDRGRQGSGEGR